MKKLMTAMTAALLSMTTAAQAAEVDPIQNTPQMYYVGGDKEVMILLADSVQVTGDHRRFWSLNIPHEPLREQGVQFDFIWMLLDIDCKAVTARIERAQVVGSSGALTLDLNSTPTPISANTPGATIHDVVCHANRDNTKLVTTEMVARAAVEYRKRQF